VTREKANVCSPDLTHTVTSHHMPCHHHQASSTPCTRQPDSNERQHPYIFHKTSKGSFHPLACSSSSIGRSQNRDPRVLCAPIKGNAHKTTRIKYAQAGSPTEPLRNNPDDIKVGIGIKEVELPLYPYRRAELKVRGRYRPRYNYQQA
jgi:hypothetical protein